ncbi:hypothetical protein SKAU_G00286910 [Synaphobranchus kaupii]|uniref:Uncharacterized protein n=1 Tax=Synaphobranchus kaupii TaxID=118154 RepID=A0A9Q1IPI2_SYNKA|nr:hypothetical protein SKAU_G00286910 [Synaphobranchus kaupii]
MATGRLADGSECAIMCLERGPVKLGIGQEKRGKSAASRSRDRSRQAHNQTPSPPSHLSVSAKVIFCRELLQTPVLHLDSQVVFGLAFDVLLLFPAQRSESGKRLPGRGTVSATEQQCGSSLFESICAQQIPSYRPTFTAVEFLAPAPWFCVCLRADRSGPRVGAGPASGRSHLLVFCFPSQRFYGDRLPGNTPSGKTGEFPGAAPCLSPGAKSRGTGVCRTPT